MARAWAANTDEVLQSHNVTISKGLSAQRIEKIRAEFGSNELDK